MIFLHGTRVPRVLLVDDDVDAVHSYARTLILEGYEVETAANGEEGVAAALQGKFDAVITDFMMPRLDGLQMLRRLRASACCTTTPVGIITGQYEIDHGILGELYRLGALVRYKPLWLEDLSELAQALVASRDGAL